MSICTNYLYGTVANKTIQFWVSTILTLNIRTGGNKLLSEKLLSEKLPIKVFDIFSGKKNGTFIKANL